MPPKYEYRHLSLAEREAIVGRRLARGYPLHAPPHPFRHAAHYLITAANYDHTPLMAEPERRTEFEASLLAHMAGIAADVVGWVVLPNHYHIVVGVDRLDDVSSTLRRLHGATAHEWNVADGMTGKRRVWYKFHDRVIRDEAHYYRTLNYVHYNPVKHGHVVSPYDWPWMSLEMYRAVQGVEWLRDLWRHYPPDGDLWGVDPD